MDDNDINKVFPNRVKRMPLGPVANQTVEVKPQSELEQAKQLAASFGFKPTEFVDLEAVDPLAPISDIASMEPIIQAPEGFAPKNPVYAKPEIVETAKGLPPVVKAPKIISDESAPHIASPNSPKPATGGMSQVDQEMSAEFTRAFQENRKPTITNALEEAMSAVYMQTRKGKFPYTFEDPDELGSPGPDYTRFDNISGRLPYRRAQHKGIIYVKDMTIEESAALAKAMSARSYTLLSDALGKLINIPYRHLTIADHVQFMYWVLISSYPPMRLNNLEWTSTLYGVSTKKGAAAKFKVTETVFEMDAEEWTEYESMGFTLPRVYDTEHFQALQQKPDSEIELYLLTLAQYLDPTHPVLQPFVNKAAENGSTAPRLQGRLDYLGKQKMRDRVALDKFRARAASYGVEESVFMKADVSKLTIAHALDFLQVIPEDDRNEAQNAELKRLLALLPPEADLMKYVARKDELTDKADKSEDEVAELKTLEANNPWDAKLTSVEEELPFNRDVWRFFPFLYSVNAA